MTDHIVPNTGNMSSAAFLFLINLLKTNYIADFSIKGNLEKYFNQIIGSLFFFLKDTWIGSCLSE